MLLVQKSKCRPAMRWFLGKYRFTVRYHFSGSLLKRAPPVIAVEWELSLHSVFDACWGWIFVVCHVVALFYAWVNPLEWILFLEITEWTLFLKSLTELFFWKSVVFFIGFLMKLFFESFAFIFLLCFVNFDLNFAMALLLTCVNQKMSCWP